MDREALEREIASLYGSALGAARGVVHVASACPTPNGELISLRIAQDTPQSETDQFVLAWARARADAIVTTGRILRSEPRLSHAAPEALSPALIAWRREVVGRSEPPVSVVLTGREDLDFAHPLFRSAKRSLVYTTPAVGEALGPGARSAGVEIATDAAPDLSRLIRRLMQDFGCGSVLLEAGPSTLQPLYREPGKIDELLLSVCERLDLPASLQGESWFRPETLRRAGLSRSSSIMRDEVSGPWRFERYVA